MMQEQQRPSTKEFIDFSLYAGDRQSHPVHKWLLTQQPYRHALQGLSCKGDDVDFAQRVSYCLGHYYGERTGVAWRGSRAGGKRKAAARAYQKALKWCRSGFGPYAEDDRDKLAGLLLTARDYMFGKHISTGFRMKAGAHRPVGMLIRELVVFLDIFSLKSLSPVITDLVSIVADDVDLRTVQRHVKEYKRELKATDR